MNPQLPELPRQYIDSQLDLLAGALERASYPGYPETKDRLVCVVAALGQTATGAFEVPEGPWMVPGNIPMRSDNLRPSALAADNLRHQGYQTDSEGRPLHLWFQRMVEDPRIGVLGGKGAYWNWGPNRTADSVVVHGDAILLIERGDTGDWALPGGFINGNEHAARAARREAAEETGVQLGRAWGIPIYKGPVVDPRMTAHAWPETTAYLFSLPAETQRPPALGADDARRAEWVPLEQIRNLRLFGSHLFLARLALAQLGVVAGALTASEVPAASALPKPEPAPPSHPLAG